MISFASYKKYKIATWIMIWIYLKMWRLNCAKQEKHLQRIILTGTMDALRRLFQITWIRLYKWLRSLYIDDSYIASFTVWMFLTACRIIQWDANHNFNFDSFLFFEFSYSKGKMVLIFYVGSKLFLNYFVSVLKF
jgi:hypothetical protein